MNKGLFDESANAPSSLGLLPYMRSKAPGATLLNAYHKEGIAPADVAIFLSPEFNIDYTREFIAAARPRMVIVFVHEPSMDLK